MRTWALLAAATTTAALTAATFGACSGPPPSPGGSQRGGAKPPTHTRSAELRDGGASAPSLTGAQTGDAAPSADPAPWRAAQHCSDPQTTILNQPDGGVVFNNAMTSADAGFIDRTQGIIDALVEQSPKIRCCLDEWTRARPGIEGRLMLLVELDGAGKATSVQIDAARSNVADDAAVPCVLDVARHTSYPQSPTGKVTLVEYPFVFVAGQR